MSLTNVFFLSAVLPLRNLSSTSLSSASLVCFRGEGIPDGFLKRNIFLFRFVFILNDVFITSHILICAKISPKPAVCVRECFCLFFLLHHDNVASDLSSSFLTLNIND